MTRPGTTRRAVAPMSTSRATRQPGAPRRCAGGWLLLPVLGLLAISLTACADGPVAQPTDWTEGPGYRLRALAVRGDGAGFRAVAESGLDFVNVLTDEGIVQNRHRMNGSGVAVGDVDGDGRPDVFFAAMESRPSLYRNLGSWQFENITEPAGLTGVPNYSTGAVFADVDGDADLDLFVTALTAPNQLWLNDGAGAFALADAGLASNRGSMSAAFADTDGDGDLDLYVTNYKRIAARDSLSPERLLFDALVGPDGQVIPEMRDHYRIEERDGRPLRLELGEEDQYYLNRGDGTFEPAPIPGVGRDWGLGVRLQDLSGDGIPDLYVANDFESPDYFLLGDGQGGWLPGTPVVGHTPNSSMSVAAADLDHDGAMDIFVPDMRSPHPLRSRFQAGTAAPPEPGSVPQYMQNALYLGTPHSNSAVLPSFSDVAWAWGVAATEWSWSGIFLDVDLDGWDDLLVSTGHSYDVQDVDAQAREREAIRRVRSVDGFRRLILDYPTLELPNGAYRNVGGTRFETVEDGWGIGAEADITHGMALGDFDGDGDLDLVTNRLNQPAGLFENTSGEPRIAIRMVEGSAAAPGSGIRVSGGKPRQEAVVGSQYLSGSESLLVLAAPSDSIQVSFVGRDNRWGHIMARPNRLYEISDIPLGEDIGHVDPAFAKPPGVSVELVQAQPAPDRTGGPVNERHPLIPRPLDSGRPLATGDLDDDGQDELLVGGTFTEPATVHGADYALPLSPVNWSDAAIADGKIIATVAGPSGSVRLQVMDSGGISQDLALNQTRPVSLATADVDGDGHVDAFLGARGAAGRYPETEPSTLFLGSPRGFTAGPSFDAGMVTGAAFGDVDGDGDPDLAVATDWGPVRLFINTNGTLAEQTDAWGLTQATGLWQDVAWGDVDGDGRQDLVATNWGWNSRYGRIGAADNPGRTLRLFYSDHDGDGRPDPVEAEYRPDLEAWSPITDFNTLRSALPLLARRISTWHAYAEASIEKLFGTQTAIHEVSTLATTVFFNRGDRFEAVSLPEVVQRTPGQGVVVAGAASDRPAEIFLAQNVYDFNLAGTARQDAGSGLVLSWTDGQWTVRMLELHGDQDHVVLWRGSPVVGLRDGSVFRIPLR